MFYKKLFSFVSRNVSLALSNIRVIGILNLNFYYPIFSQFLL